MRKIKLILLFCAVFLSILLLTGDKDRIQADDDDSNFTNLVVFARFALCIHEDLLYGRTSTWVSGLRGYRVAVEDSCEASAVEYIDSRTDGRHRGIIGYRVSGEDTRESAGGTRVSCAETT